MIITIAELRAHVLLREIVQHPGIDADLLGFLPALNRWEREWIEETLADLVADDLVADDAHGELYAKRGAA